MENETILVFSFLELVLPFLFSGSPSFFFFGLFAYLGKERKRIVFENTEFFNSRRINLVRLFSFGLVVFEKLMTP